MDCITTTIEISSLMGDFWKLGRILWLHQLWMVFSIKKLEFNTVLRKISFSLSGLDNKIKRNCMKFISSVKKTNWKEFRAWTFMKSCRKVTIRGTVPEIWRKMKISNGEMHQIHIPIQLWITLEKLRRIRPIQLKLITDPNTPINVPVCDTFTELSKAKEKTNWRNSPRVTSPLGKF